MFTRRLATFILGMWMGCCLLLDLICLQNERFVSLMISNPAPSSEGLLTKVGTENAGALLQYMASEQIRAFLRNWELGQFVAFALIILTLALSDQRKAIPLSLCGAIVLLLSAQHFVLSVDLTALGRQTDFMADTASAGLRVELHNMAQVYGICEAVKLAIGGALASYLFAMQATVVRKGRRNPDGIPSVAGGRA